MQSEDILILGSGPQKTIAKKNLKKFMPQMHQLLSAKTISVIMLI